MHLCAFHYMKSKFDIWLEIQQITHFPVFEYLLPHCILKYIVNHFVLFFSVYTCHKHVPICVRQFEVKVFAVYVFIEEV